MLSTSDNKINRLCFLITFVDKFCLVKEIGENLIKKIFHSSPSPVCSFKKVFSFCRTTSALAKHLTICNNIETTKNIILEVGVEGADHDHFCCLTLNLFSLVYNYFVQKPISSIFNTKLFQCCCQIWFSSVAPRRTNRQIDGQDKTQTFFDGGYNKYS